MKDSGEDCRFLIVCGQLRQQEKKKKKPRADGKKKWIESAFCLPISPSTKTNRSCPVSGILFSVVRTHRERSRPFLQYLSVSGTGLFGTLQPANLPRLRGKKVWGVGGGTRCSTLSTCRTRGAKFLKVISNPHKDTQAWVAQPRMSWSCPRLQTCPRTHIRIGLPDMGEGTPRLRDRVLELNCFSLGLCT